LFRQVDAESEIAFSKKSESFQDSQGCSKWLMGFAKASTHPARPLILPDARRANHLRVFVTPESSPSAKNIFVSA